MAETCLIYLQSFGETEPVDVNVSQIFPLAKYAASHWMTHCEWAASDSGQKLYDLKMSLFDTEKSLFHRNWLCIINNFYRRFVAEQAIKHDYQFRRPRYFNSWTLADIKKKKTEPAWLPRTGTRHSLDTYLSLVLCLRVVIMGPSSFFILSHIWRNAKGKNVEFWCERGISLAKVRLFLLRGVYREFGGVSLDLLL